MSQLSLIYASTTKLSLVLNPSSPTYSASLAPLKDLITHISGITHCVSLLHPDEHGSTLRKEAQGTVQDVIKSVRELMETFLRSSVGSGKCDEYLIRTGEIHDLIDRARNGMSKNNLAAVKKVWEMDMSALEDGLREIGEMIEDVEHEEDEEDIDDGWGELGLHGSGQKMNEEEIERTKKVSIHKRL
jgi:cyclin-D1-binding protein 1